MLFLFQNWWCFLLKSWLTKPFKYSENFQWAINAIYDLRIILNWLREMNFTKKRRKVLSPLSKTQSFATIVKRAVSYSCKACMFSEVLATPLISSKCLQPLKNTCSAWFMENWVPSFLFTPLWNIPKPVMNHR